MLISNILQLLDICKNLSKDDLSPKDILFILRRAGKSDGSTLSKDELIHDINIIQKNISLYPDFIEFDFEKLIDALKMKPMRSESGVTTVTLLTKPYACPGKCIFCPNDIRMPKSYIATEPGAQRALMNAFSPYSQVFNRLKALKAIGHPTAKIELLILGGTWSSYPDKYQRWFIFEAFRAMEDFSNEVSDEKSIVKKDITSIFKEDVNDNLYKKYPQIEYNHLLNTPEIKEWKNEFIAKEKDVSIEDLKNIQIKNSTSNVRCVGLVLETRSDKISKEEVIKMRSYGATKVQLGIQILDDEISDFNLRGETIKQCETAFKWLRAGGFKIHAHIMPNLYKATPEKDFQSYKKIFEDHNFRPDEMKIYPTSLIKYTSLDILWREGKYSPYDTSTLVELIAKMMEITPAYCRITRVIRDIPSTEIEAGNLTTNLREIVEHKLSRESRKNQNIRAREIRNKKVNLEDLILDIIEYKTLTTIEYFLQYVTSDYQIAGFLRLSIPNFKQNELTEELNDCAIIREVHVYGPSLKISTHSEGQAQHLGLGSKLINRAKELAKEKGYHKLAVISAIGTREYYASRGFRLIDLYQIADI